MHQTKMWYLVIFLVIGFSSASGINIPRGPKWKPSGLRTTHKSTDYYLTVTQDESLSPFENMVFNATVTEEDGTIVTEELTYYWTDNAIPQNSKTSVSSDGHSTWTVPYTRINAPVDYKVMCLAMASNAEIILFSWALFVFPFFLAFIK